MSLTAQAARRIRILVVTACVLVGAALPFLIPGADAARAFTDLEARIGYGAFAVVVHALIGALIGAGLAEFVVWAGGGARDVDFRSQRSTRRHPPNDAEHR